MTLYGYARVSAEGQELGRQIDALMQRGVPRDRIHEETASTRGRLPVLDHLTREVMGEGDTLVIDSLDRLSRDTARILVSVDDLRRQGIALESLYERVDASTADGAFTLSIFAALAQRERDRLSERTRAGLEAARTRGRHPGRPVAVTPEQHETTQMLRGLGKSYRQIAAATGLSASTVARICRQETPGHRGYRESAEGQATLHP
jgi:putative DNA-invertase from lambdoid prophage Rac